MLNKLFAIPENPPKITTKVSHNGTPAAMKREYAVEICERALLFLANRPEELQRFLTASGLDGIDLLEGSGDPVILSAVLFHVAGVETLAKEFSAEENLKPGTLLQACATLDPHGSSSW
jgi:Protein of unknown function (DUF3572)